MSSKKIIFINYSSYVSGAEFSLKQLIVGINPSVKKYLITTGNHFFFKGYEEKCVLNESHKFKTWFYNVIKSIKFLLKVNPDILYFNNSKSFILLFPLSIFFFRKKIIWHIRDNIKFKLIENLLCFFCDKIICNSKYIFNQLFFNNKAVVVYNGIDTDLFVPTIEYNNKKKLIAIVSQITPWKKLEDFIEIVKIISFNFPNTDFLIIGDILNPKDLVYKKKLENLIIKYSLEKEIKFIGFKENIEDYMSKIDVLCHMASKEPFGRVLIEAMSCGKPVIAYMSGGPKEIITEKTGFLIPTGEIEIFANKIEELLRDDELRINMGKNARKHILNNFSEFKYIYEIEKLLEI